jgi:hypothetical protein
MRNFWLFIFVITAMLCLGGCGLGRAGALALLTADTAPSGSKLESFHINTVMIDTDPRADATYSSNKAVAEIVTHYRETLRGKGWQEKPCTLGTMPGETKYLFERFGVELEITVGPKEDHGSMDKPGSVISTSISIEYPWDIYACRYVQCLAWGLTGQNGSQPALMLIGVF